MVSVVSTDGVHKEPVETIELDRVATVARCTFGRQGGEAESPHGSSVAVDACFCFKMFTICRMWTALN